VRKVNNISIRSLFNEKGHGLECEALRNLLAMSNLREKRRRKKDINEASKNGEKNE